MRWGAITVETLTCLSPSLDALEPAARHNSLLVVLEPGTNGGVLAIGVLNEHQHVVGGGMGRPCELASGHFRSPPSIPAEAPCLDPGIEVGCRGFAGPGPSAALDGQHEE